MSLPTYASLTTAHRGDPCKEYPGTWYVYADGEQVGQWIENGEDAYQRALAQADALPDAKRISVSWGASDDDPRIGKVWFTGYYSAWSRTRNWL